MLINSYTCVVQRKVMETSLAPLKPGNFHFKRYNLPMLGKSLQLCNSPVDCARELCKPSKDSASLLPCNEKKIRFWGVCRWHHKWNMLLGSGPQPQEGSISLKSLVETRLKFKYFEPLLDFLTFLVQKLW